MKTPLGLVGLAISALLVLAGCSSPNAPTAGPRTAGSSGSSQSSTASTPASPTSSSPASSSPASSSPASSSPASSSSPSLKGQVIQVTLADGKVTPNGQKIDAKVGDVVTFVINSDHDDEIHIHGIDIAIEVKAGQEVTQEVTLSAAGSYEVESHHPAKVIVILNVR